MQEWKLENEAIKAGVEAARAQEHLSKAEERAAKRTEKRMQKRNEQLAMQQKNSEKQAALINVSRPLAQRPHAIDEITKKLANQREARREQMQKQIEAKVKSKKASSQAWEAERRKQSEQTRRKNTSKEAVDKMTQKRKEVSAKLAGYAEMLTK